MAREGKKQITLKAVKDRVEAISAEKVEARLQDIAEFAIDVSPEDTGAYVESFSFGKAGFGGGRAKSSKARSGKANGAAKELARVNLSQDIQGLNVKETLALERVSFTLRNRAPHARQVEDGWLRADGSKTQGYEVFTKIRSKFR
jgi:hypothetical protein